MKTCRHDCPDCGRYWSCGPVCHYELVDPTIVLVVSCAPCHLPEHVPGWSECCKEIDAMFYYDEYRDKPQPDGAWR
jgi:hypothetical protein